jgi:hypothetical protein
LPNTEVVEVNVEKAINKYGEEYVNKKINAIVGEMLEWLQLDEVVKDEDEDEDENEDENENEAT